MRKSGKAVGRANLKKALAELKADLPAKKNKFGAVRTTRHGIAFHSKGEADRYDELLMLDKAGEIAGVALQRRYKLTVNNTLVATYIADFVYWDDKAATIIVEDFKGHRTPEYLLKKKLFEALYAPLKITETHKASRRLTRRKRRTK